MDIKRIASLAVSLSLLLPTLALANGQTVDDPPPYTSGRSGGSRGCSTNRLITAENPPTLILLAPSQGFGQTTNTRPSFAWFVNEPEPKEMEFRLYKYDSASQEEELVTKIHDKNFKSSTGIMVLSLGAPLPELSVNQTYVWQVVLKCESGQPDSYLSADAAIKVVDLPAELATKLADEEDILKKAALYQNANLWYDSLNMAITAKSEPQGEELMLSLLEQIADNKQESSKLQTSSIYQVKP
ncbi:MAG: DUF928 domain-containing protein [Coleofasciculaceae cyanobacterium]